MIAVEVRPMCEKCKPGEICIDGLLDGEQAVRPDCDECRDLLTECGDCPGASGTSKIDGDDSVSIWSVSVGKMGFFPNTGDFEEILVSIAMAHKMPIGGIVCDGYVSRSQPFSDETFMMACTLCGELARIRRTEVG